MSDSKTIQVTLAKPHTHAGVKHAAGATIAVPAADAAWLESHGIANALKKSRTTTPRTLGVTHE